MKLRNVENISINGLNAECETGIYGDYASNIDLNNIRVSADNGIPVEFKNSDNIQIRDLTIRKIVNEMPAISLTDVDNILVKDCFQSVGISNYIKVTGVSKGIYVVDNVLSGVEKLTNEKKSVKQKNNIIGDN